MKKKTLKTLFVMPALLVLATVIDCGGGGGNNNPPPPTTGFSVNATNIFLGSDGQYHLYGGTSFHADWQHDNGSAQGSTLHSFGFTNPSAFAPVPDGRVPARWLIYPDGACLRTTDPNRDVTAGSQQSVECLIAISFLLANPDSIDLGSPAPVVTISGGGFDTSYGMPVAEYYDQYSGALIGTSTAFSVAGDGSYLQAYTPDLSGAYSGVYNIVVSNINWDGSYSPAGVATFAACCVDPPPPPPPPDPPGCSEGGVCEIQ